MIRKLILPAIALLLLAGCATGYNYRNGSGDYYYGQPGTVYRDYYGGYYGGGYYSPYAWGGSYRYGYGYPYGYYGRYPYYHGHGYPHYPRPGNNDGDGGSNGGTDTPDRATPPWRDLGQIQERRRPAQAPRRAEQLTRPTTQLQRTAPRPTADYRGSAMSKMIRRAQSKRDGGRSIEE